MGRIRRYNELMNGISPHYTNVIVQPRGFPIFSDPLLKGQVRFARKTGADFAIINPDNEIQLLAATPRNAQTLFLERPNRWLEIGAVLSIGPDIEFAIVRDFSDSLIHLTEPVTGTFTADAGVNLYASPVFPALDALAGSTTILVKSRYHILAGDKISFVTAPGLLTSLLDIKVSRARLLDVVDAEAPFSLFYEIILDQPTTVDITINQGVGSGADIYLKAQPSYLSNQVFIPQVPRHPDDIGPFLLDYVSGVLFDRPEVEEQVSLTVFDKLGNPIVDDNLFPLPINKQFPITEMPVMGDSVVLWKVASGAMTFGKRGVSQEITAIAVCDELGQFQTTQEVIPTLPSGTEWNVPVEASTPCTLKVTFVPNEPREFNLAAATSRQVLIGTTSDDEPVERIEIIVIGQDDTQVQLGNWVPTENQAFSLVYGITADVFGEAQWQATNMFQKPYFLNFAMGLKGTFDSSQTPNRFDGGMLFL
jgi:hypothetical protein